MDSCRQSDWHYCSFKSCLPESTQPCPEQEAPPTYQHEDSNCFGKSQSLRTSENRIISTAMMASIPNADLRTLKSCELSTTDSDVNPLAALHRHEDAIGQIFITWTHHLLIHQLTPTKELVDSQISNTRDTKI